MNPIKALAIRKLKKKLETNVNAGIEQLRCVKGLRWHDHLSPRYLNMQSKSDNPLGQVFDSHAAGLKRLSIQPEQAHQYGFSAPPQTPWLLSPTDVQNALATVWKDKLNAAKNLPTRLRGCF